MPIAMEEMVIVHEHIEPARAVSETLARLTNSGPVGFEQAVRLVKKLATTEEGMKVLKDAARRSSSHIFQHNQSNIQYLKGRATRLPAIAKVGAKSVAKFNLGSAGTQLTTNAARSYVNRYIVGVEKTF